MEEETVMELNSIPALLAQRAAAQGGATILRVKNRGIWKAVTWTDLSTRAGEIGGGLTAAGIGPGDTVAILSETRLEVVYADLAVLGCGAASLAVDPDTEAEQVAAVLALNRVRLAFVENEEQLDKLLSVRDRCPALARIVIIDMAGLRDFADPACVALPAFIGASSGWPAAVAPDQPAVIDAGGVLTHGALWTQLSSAALPVRAGDERLVVQRLSDPLERVWGLYLALYTGCISNFPEGPDTIIENLRELQPTVLGADPVVWDHLAGLSAASAKGATATQRIAYDWAIRSGGGLADFLVLRAVRSAFGLRRIRLAYTSGTPANATTAAWLSALGIEIQTAGAVALAPQENAYA